MKVVPQIITFLVILAIGWYAYERHEAFRVLVDDVIDYSGVTRDVTRKVVDTRQQSEVMPVDKAESTQSQEAVVATTDAVVEENKARTEQILTQESKKKEPAPVEEAVVWPDEVKPLAVEKELAEPEDLTAGKTDDIKSEILPTESAVKAVPQTDKAPMEEKEEVSSSEPLPEEPIVLESDGDKLLINNNKAVAQPPVEDTRQPVNETKPAEIASPPAEMASPPAEMPSPPAEVASPIVSRKQLALAGLAEARAAWHQGDHDKSVNLYNELMREYKNHPDFAGELGNIYFSRGQMDMAVNAYSEAFLRLLRNQDVERAQEVLGIVYNIDRDQAARLNEYLSQ